MLIDYTELSDEEQRYRRKMKCSSGNYWKALAEALDAEYRKLKQRFGPQEYLPVN